MFKLGTVGAEQDFFLDLGGHSLLAAQTVTAFCAASADVHIAVRDIYAYPSVRKLAGLSRGRSGPSLMPRRQPRGCHIRRERAARTGVRFQRAAGADHRRLSSFFASAPLTIVDSPVVDDVLRGTHSSHCSRVSSFCLCSRWCSGQSSSR